MNRKLLLFLLFICHCFLPIAYARHAQIKDQASSSSYDQVNFDAFEIVSKEVQELEFSTQTIGNRKELVIHLLGTSYEVQVHFKSNVQKKSGFFRKGSFILPAEPIKYAYLVNRETDTFTKLEITAFHETDKFLDYIAGADTARLDIYTDLQGRISHVSVVHELEKGGMEEYRKFLKIYKTLKRNKASPS